MKTILSSNNPFRNTLRLEHAFVWEFLKKQHIKFENVLDYGSYDGNLLKELANSNLLINGVGVDLNKEVVKTFQDSLPKNIQLVHIEKNNTIPYPDNYFDCITFIGVLEHIHRQDLILSELNRILKPGGILLVSVPGKHLFSFLDFGNWKFIFPRIHKLYIVSKFGKDFYNERFVECKNGLFGDIEVEKKWHEHFDVNGLSKLLSSFGFTTKESDGFGFFFRLLHNLHYLSPFFKEFLFSLMKRDMLKYSQAEIFIAAEKLNGSI
jgi:SAM-dependent methyltransferase